MAELTFKSPGVSTREIDLSGPSQTGPSGIPAGVIGTAKQGRAFVPITVANFSDFIAEFGDVDTDLFGPMALRQWLNYANAGTYVKTLGVGDGKKRTASGAVTNAGFTVGERLPKASSGILADNPFAGPNLAASSGTLSSARGLETRDASPASAFGAPQADKLVLYTGTIVIPAAVSSTGALETLTIQFTMPDVTGTDPAIPEAAAANTINICIRGVDASSSVSGNELALLIDDAINGVQNAADSAKRIVYGASTGGVGTGGYPGLTCVDTGRLLALTIDKGGLQGNNATLKITRTGGVGMTTPAVFFATSAVADNTNVFFTGALGPHSGLGRTHILATMMSQSATLRPFSEAGLTDVHPIIRGVLLAPSGVNLTLSASRPSVTNNTPWGAPGATNRSSVFLNRDIGDAGSTVGAVNIAAGRQEFVLLQNGHSHTKAYPTIVTASFDPEAANYFANVFNTDPAKTQEAGHLLYAHYDIHPTYAAVTASADYMQITFSASFDGVKEGTAIKNEDIAFLVTGSAARDTGSSTVPNFESFTDRFKTAKFPTVISQEFGGLAKDLFTVHCLDDGSLGNTRVKVSIENINKSTNSNNKWGTFDLLVRDYYDEDTNATVVERFNKLSLNPNDERYITRVIGDYHIFYDFDKRIGGQKLVVEGSYANASNYIRISPSVALERGEIPDTALPIGFRGISHLVTSGSSIIGEISNDSPGATDAGTAEFRNVETLQQLVQPPIPMRLTIAQGQTPKKRVNSSLYWGIQTTKQKSATEPNASMAFNHSISSYGVYFPDHLVLTQAISVGDNPGVSDVTGTIFDCDRFNNNKFSLDKIQVITTTADQADSEQWAGAVYRRDGVATSTMLDIDGVSTSNTRLLNVDKDFGLLSARKYLRFTMIPQGGFDGLNVFDDNKSKMTDIAIRREMADTNQGLDNGPTVAAYKKAIDVLGERSDVDIQLLAIPGIRQPVITDHAIDKIEDRFDALYIMDVPVIDTLNTPVTSSVQEVSVTNTATTFGSRNIDTSFAAAYFPDVILQDQVTGASSQIPPSVAVLGAFGLNDSVAFPWYAPAGFTRGALKNVLETQVKLNRDNLDTLYDVDINPLTSFAQSNDVVVFGQKTLLAAQSALDRVNVRRLLIDIRRQVRKIGDTFLFEPNRESTLSKFSAAVTPVLSRIQAQQGLERFKVQIDTTTTTQADIENNTVRGKIFLQPVRSVEFISLDFVVTNAGLDI